MPKRYLVWNFQTPRDGSGAQGAVFYLDHSYDPGALRLYAGQAPSRDMKVDVRLDGATIFNGFYATLNKGANLEENAEDYPDTAPDLTEGSVVSFHFIDSGDAQDITAQLELFTQSDDDDDGTDSDDEDAAN